MITATIKDRDLVITILVSAFRNDHEANSINLMVGNGDKRIRRMEVLMGFLFDRTIRKGKVYLSDTKNTCLLLDFSSSTKINISSIKEYLKLISVGIGIKNFKTVIQRQAILKKHIPKGAFIKPIIFGSKDGKKGMLSAGKLLLEVLKKHEGNQLPVIVDTVTEYNVRLYKKIGFKELSKDESLGYPIHILRLN